MGIRLDQQYILFPQSSEQTTFSVSWVSSGRAQMWVTENTLNGNWSRNFIGADGTSGSLRINATSGVYWIIFMASDQDLVDGGVIHCDVEYPAGVSVITYFQQASNYVT